VALEVFTALKEFKDEKDELAFMNGLQLKMEDLDNRYGYFDQLYVDEALDREPPVAQKESDATERRLLIGRNSYGHSALKPHGYHLYNVYCGPVCLQDGKSIPCGSGTYIYMNDFTHLIVIEGACEVAHANFSY